MTRVGIDLGGTKIEAIALRGSRVLIRRRTPTPASRGYDAIVDTIRAMVRGIEEELEESVTVGVGTPGAIDPRAGTLKNSNTTCLNGRPLRDDLCTALAREVRLANDADCFALSEAIDGAGAGAAIVFGVIVGTGTGGGLVIDGRLQRSANAIRGEWGHNPLPWPRPDELPGPACYCGRRGCIETWLSGPAIARDHRRTSGEEASSEALGARDDEPARASLARHADRFARALASVINIVDPHIVVLGGGVSNLPRLAENIATRLPAWVFSETVETGVRIAEHGDSSGVRGAAWLWPEEEVS